MPRPKARKTPRRSCNRGDAAPPGPVVLSLELTAEEHQSLLQIHSVLNTTGKGWTRPQIVKACCRLAAVTLGLSVPGEGIWRP
jgi:hypothetical protein